MTKQEKDRDSQPVCPTDHSSVLQGQILPVLWYCALLAASTCWWQQEGGPWDHGRWVDTNIDRKSVV